MIRERFVVAFVCLFLLTTVVAGQAGASQPDPGTDINQTACEFPLTISDATGTDITIDSPPNDIVVLSPSDAQMVWKVGASDRVIGMPVSQYTSYLSDHQRPSDITGADGLTVSSETVIGLDPDLVLAGNVSDPETIATLREAGLTVYHYSEAQSINDVLRQTETSGLLLDRCSEAAAQVNEMETTLEEIDTATSSVDRPIVYYAMGDGWTAGHETFQHEIIQQAGGENLGGLADIRGWEVLSEEIILEHDPDWIVFGHTWDDPPVRDSVQETTAWETDSLAVVNSHYMSQPGPRIVDAIVELFATFHPDLFEETIAAEWPDAGSVERNGLQPQDGLGVGVVGVAIIGSLLYLLKVKRIN